MRNNGSDCERSRIIGLRYLPQYIASVLPFVVSMLLIYPDILFIFSRSRRTLHDRIADTKVIDVRDAS